MRFRSAAGRGACQECSGCISTGHTQRRPGNASFVLQTVCHPLQDVCALGVHCRLHCRLIHTAECTARCSAKFAVWSMLHNELPLKKLQAAAAEAEPYMRGSCRQVIVCRCCGMCGPQGICVPVCIPSGTLYLSQHLFVTASAVPRSVL